MPCRTEADDGDAPDLPPVPREGLSLAALRTFAAAHAGVEYRVLVDEKAKRWELLPFERLTTAQVCEAVVKPATARARGGGACAYAHVLRDEPDGRGAPSVARATRFVSHAWAYSFADLLAALLAHAPADDAEYYWIGAHPPRACSRACPAPEASLRARTDIFVCNQHTATSLAFSWWFHAFGDAVAQIAHTVLVLQPWQSPRPLTRSWCLWEINSTIASGGQLDIALAPQEREAFHRVLVRQAAHMRSTAQPAAEAASAPRSCTSSTRSETA